MLDIGFQNLSRLLASGKPIRVVVLDTQVYSNTGGQSCTSGFTGQVADMAAFGKAQHGKTETRKELSLIALAHRGAYVLQTSQASPSHMMQGILHGLNSKRPAVFNIYTPCPVEHGVADEWAPHSARLALESRAFPFMTFDPDAGEALADCISLDGNPEVEDDWPTYELKYLDDDGTEQVMELPVTTGDWAATEGRFKKHFRPVKDGDDLVPFAEFVEMSAEDRMGRTPFIYTLAEDRTLDRLVSSLEMVELAEDRQLLWSQMKQLAGLEVAPWVKDRLGQDMEDDFDQKARALRQEYEAKMAELKASYPSLIAHRLAEGLLRAGRDRTIAEVLNEAASAPPVQVDTAVLGGVALGAGPEENGGGGTAVAAPPPQAPSAEVAAPAAPAVEEEEEEEALAMEPYIDTALCTSCNECTNINRKLFAYDDNKQAYIKDARAGTFAEIVKAAELCPAGIIHPGTPLNPRERDLEKWIERAKPFN
jgi:pyruvate-ferredoxin/flavodoxin oxidoreductase